MLRVRVLGSAAGGGFPQWNCALPGSQRARLGDPKARPRSQTSVAVSADGSRWVVLNASPDIRQQFAATAELHPRPDTGAVRHSPTAAVVLTGAEIDTIAGLLSLREGHHFALYAMTGTLKVLAANPVFGVLPPDRVPRRLLEAGCAVRLQGTQGEDLGLDVEAISVPGKAPLFQGDVASAEMTIGLRISDNASKLFFIPGCAAMTPELAERLRGAACVMFDGTLWRDDEMVLAGAAPKTGRQMGHMSLDGPDGTLAAFAKLDVRRKILIHLNTTNPVLLDDSAERRAVEAAGWEVAHDGMEVTL